jgi:hypothetical protein
MMLKSEMRQENENKDKSKMCPIKTQKRTKNECERRKSKQLKRDSKNCRKKQRAKR